MARGEDTFVATAFEHVVAVVNGTATAFAAARPNLAFFCTGYRISFNGTPGAAVQAELREGGQVRVRYELPAVYIPAIVVNLWDRPFEFAANTLVELVLPAMGVGIRGTVELNGFYSEPS